LVAEAGSFDLFLGKWESATYRPISQLKPALLSDILDPGLVRMVEYLVSALAEEIEKEVLVGLLSEVWIGELWWSRAKGWRVV
jgi:hypothetical protein